MRVNTRVFSFKVNINRKWGDVNMNPKHLEFFAAVVQYGSINKAAQELYVSQPHLSHIIRDIEDEVGVPLLKRSKQGVTLTPEGEEFLKYAKIILKEMENLKLFSRRSKPHKERLSVSMTKFSHTMESFNEICAKNQRQESFSYCLREGTAIDVVDDVINKASDVGVIHYACRASERIRAQAAEKNLELLPIASLTPHIVISKNHTLIRQGKPVTLESLKNYGFVRYLGQYEDFIYNISTGTRHTDLNNSSKITYVYGRAALLHLISTSNFYTIGIQSFLTQDSMYQIVSVPISSCVEQLEFSVITRRGAELTPTEQDFIDDVTRRYSKLQSLELQETNEAAAALHSSQYNPGPRMKHSTLSIS